MLSNLQEAKGCNFATLLMQHDKLEGRFFCPISVIGEGKLCWLINSKMLDVTAENSSGEYERRMERTLKK